MHASTIHMILLVKRCMSAGGAGMRASVLNSPTPSRSHLDVCCSIWACGCGWLEPHDYLTLLLSTVIGSRASRGASTRSHIKGRPVMSAPHSRGVPYYRHSVCCMLFPMSLYASQPAPLYIICCLPFHLTLLLYITVFCLPCHRTLLAFTTVYCLSSH